MKNSLLLIEIKKEIYEAFKVSTAPVSLGYANKPCALCVCNVF